MLEHSFIHLPGVGPQTEERLWNEGCLTWSQLSDCVFDMFGAKKAAQIAESLEESRAAFDAQEIKYFQDKLKGAEMWRLLPLCLDQVAFIDIETTGLGFPPQSHSTSIAVLLGRELHVEVEPVKKKRLLERVQEEAKLIVTFNGLCFDLPFLRREFALDLSNPHLDLRVWFRRLGLTGGLKKIQIAHPEVPQRDSMDIDGFDAVRLWRMHKRGVPNALETLMSYNAEDTVVLEPLMHLAFEKERARLLHLPLRQLVCPSPCEIPMKVDPFVYDILRGREEWQVPLDW